MSGSRPRLSRRRGRVLAAVALVCAVAPATALGVVLPGISGNPASIATEQAVVRAYTHVPAFRLVQTGGFIISDTGSSFRSGRATAPRGWTEATDEQTVALRDGREQWQEDIYTPTQAGVRPLEVLQTATGVYVRRATQAGCFRTQTLLDASPVGQPVFAVFGDYGAPVYTGSRVEIRGVYPVALTGYSSATELDILSRSSDLYVSFTIAFVPKPGSGAVPLTLRAKVTNFHHAPAEPTLSFCPIT